MNEPTQALEVVPVQEQMPLEVSRPPAPAEKITAAQAKIDAVAALTMAAYEKAATLEIAPEESAKLQADFPDDAFQPGAAGKEHLIYIEHAYLRDRFNTVFGMGKWAIVPRSRWAEDFTFTNNKGQRIEASRVYVEAMLVVRGCFVAEAVGAMEYYPKNQAQNYGDAVEGAKTAAFRRCAKEFGVGLQAWKKEWCEGWWQRRRDQLRAKTAPTATLTPAKPKAPPTVSQQPASSRPEATPEQKIRFIAILEKHGAVALDFCFKAAILLPTETLEDIPVRFVPVTLQEKDQFMACFQEFVDGGEVALPAYCRTGAVKQAAAAPNPEQDPECFKFIVPIPHKGEKRDEYLKHPDTIGSLYQAMKAGDEIAQARLWGFVSHFEPKGWTKRTGEQMPPSDVDLKFRAALDEFQKWHEAREQLEDEHRSQ